MTGLEAVVEAPDMHVPVMAGDVLAHLAAAPGDLVLDLTVGAGGHAGEFLAASAPTAQVIGVDRDERALALARARLAAFGPRVRLLHDDSAGALRRLLAEGVRVDAVLLDLGLSSMQLDDPARGFALREDAPLDMRMDESRGPTAADLLARLSEAELAHVFTELGDEPRGEALARAVVERRRSRPVRTTGDLRRLIEDALGRRYGAVHPATRAFQGLRIAVNGELDLLAEALPLARTILRPGGRLLVLSFHSGEDRLVKQAFRAWRVAGEGAVLTPKPLRPGREELRRNRRSRSARLRVFEVRP